MHIYIKSPLKLFLFYLFTFREGGGKERNINVPEKHQSISSPTPPTWPETQAPALTGN